MTNLEPAADPIPRRAQTIVEEALDPRDFRGLHQLADMAGPRFTLGAVLHTGRNALRFGPKMWALPLSALWQ